MAKRKPATDLNHENWDKEDMQDEAGEFKKASTEALRERIIIRPKRRLLGQPATTTASSNPFAAFSGFALSSAEASSNNTAKAFTGGFTFQAASSSSDSVRPPAEKSTAADPQDSPASLNSKNKEMGNIVGTSSQEVNVEPETFSFATGLPFNSKKAETRVDTTCSDSASGNEISTSSESTSLPPSLEPDSTYEARSDNGPCDSEKGLDEDESNENEIVSEKSNTNETDVEHADHHHHQNEPDSTEK